MEYKQTWLRSLLVALSLVALVTDVADARITRIQITSTEPAFGGASFGAVGPYVRLRGKAYGEVDPKSPANVVIQDIALAPRNAKGMVEYVTDLDIVRPVDLSKANGVLFFNIANRGNKGGIQLFNADVPNVAGDVNSLKTAGDGLLQRRGYVMVWYGWQADVLPGNDRMTLSVPVAHNADGTALTGLVRSELIAQAGQKALNLSSGWFTTADAAYSPVSNDNRTPLADGFLPTLTVRSRQAAPRIAVPNTEWSFGPCAESGAQAATTAQVCYPAGFRRGYVYELTYRAKDPLVLGLGFAVSRDLGTFLRSAVKDDVGTANPVRMPNARTIVMGQSQSGRYIRTFIHLGFNRGEDGTIVFDGAFPEIGGGLLALNVRWGQPGRAAGTAEVDNQMPGAEFPFTYGSQTDPLTGRTGGILDRCTATGTCPKIIHAATSLEMWEMRQSLGFTDPLGVRDLPDPSNVRTYLMVSTQHGPAPLPLPTQFPFGSCQQQPNPNPHTWTVRALLDALTTWVTTGDEPPPSARPTIAAGTLVAPEQVRFPSIPANQYGGVTRPAVKFLGLNNPLHVLDFGPDYRAGEVSGVLSGEVPRASTARYGNLVPQVDEDGNDLGGVRNVFIRVPIGTYTGWNLFAGGMFDEGFCTLNGSFIPFAASKSDRLSVGDPRRSLEERYPTSEAYVTAFKTAAADLVRQRLLLPEDAARLVEQAESRGIRQAP